MIYALRLILIAGLTLAVCGCAGSGRYRSPERELHDLSKRLKRNPRDAGARFRMANLALFHKHDLPGALARLNRLLTDHPKHASGRMMQVFSAWLSGNYRLMVTSALRMLTHTPNRHESEVALLFLRLGFDQLKGFNQQVAPILQRLLGRAELLPDLRARAETLLLMIARQEKKPALVRALRSRMGLVVRWSMVGPFGDRAILALRSRFAPETHPNQKQYPVSTPLGSATRKVVERHYPDGGVYFLNRRRGGLGYSTSWVYFDKPTAATVRLEAYRSLALVLGGKTALVRDLATSYQSSYRTVRYRFGAGWTAIQVKMPIRSGWFRLHLVADGGSTATFRSRPDSRRRAVAPVRLADRQTALRWFARMSKLSPRRLAPLVASWSLQLFGWHYNTERAKLVLGPLEKLHPRSVALKFLRARTVLRDRTLPRKISRSRARVLFRQVQKSWPDHLPANYYLGYIELRSGYRQQSIRFFKRCLATNPGFHWADVQLFYVYNRLKWYKEAEQSLKRLLTTAPSSDVARLARAFYRRRRSFDSLKKALRLHQKVSAALISDSPVRAADWQRKSTRLLQELRRLTTAYPARVSNYRALFKVLLRDKQYRAAEKLLGRTLKLKPGDTASQLNRLKLITKRDGDSAARNYLKQLIKQHPGRFHLRKVLAALRGKPYFPFPVQDGRKMLARYKAARKKGSVPDWKNFPIVTVLDGYYLRVYSDGSLAYLVHLVKVIQSKKAADQYGDWRKPASAVLLEMRTIKKDGRIVEPELGQRKGTLSFSELNIGDAIEVAYVITKPAAYRRGGYLQTLIFRTFDNPIFRQEHTVDSPRTMTLETIYNNGAPKPLVSTLSLPEYRGKRRIWNADLVRPIRREPYLPNARAIYPTVDLFVRFKDARLAWSRVIASYQAKLLPRLRSTFELQKLANKLQGVSQLETLQNGFAWIRDRIRQVGKPNQFSPSASFTLAQTKGSRVVLLLALMRIWRVPFQLWVARPVHSPSVGKMPMRDYYWYPAIRVELAGQVYWLDLYQRFVPFNRLSHWMSRAAAICILGNCPAGEIRLPKIKADRSRWKFDVTLSLNDNGDVRGRVIMKASGMATRHVRYAFSRASATLKKRYLTVWLSLWFRGARLGRYRLFNATDPDKPLRIELSFTAARGFTKRGPAWLKSRYFSLDFSPFWVRSRSLYRYVRTASRKLPMQVLPVEESATVRLVLPPKTRVLAKPKTFMMLDRFGRIQQRVSREGDLLIFERHTSVPFQLVKPQDYPAFRQFVKRLYLSIRNPLAIAPVK